MAEDFRAQITRDDIEKAIAALERGEVHAFAPSIFYDVLEGDRRYPPKQSSDLLRAARSAAHSGLMSFREARSPGRSDCFATEASMS